MLETWLECLEKEKSKAIDELRKICNDGIFVLATREIEYHFLSVREYLNRISDGGFTLNNDLSGVKEIYDGENLEYRTLCNGVNHHLWEMRRIPVFVNVEGEDYHPIYVR